MYYARTFHFHFTNSIQNLLRFHYLSCHYYPCLFLDIESWPYFGVKLRKKIAYSYLKVT